MKHNNVIANQHFHKDWQRYVKTWFNQPSRKVSRRTARSSKASKIAPRPLHLLRPIVRGQTNKYNNKIRAGKGFTLEELRGSGLNPREAIGIGLSVDHRRKNRSEESYQLNVARLKLYKSELVVFPRNPTSKRAKKGDANKETQSKVKQVITKQVLPVTAPQPRIKPRKITKDEREATVTAVLRKALTDAKLWGVREKRAKDKAEAASAKGAKGKKEDDMGDE